METLSERLAYLHGLDGAAFWREAQSILRDHADQLAVGIEPTKSGELDAGEDSQCDKTQAQISEESKRREEEKRKASDRTRKRRRTNG